MSALRLAYLASLVTPACNSGTIVSMDAHNDLLDLYVRPYYLQLLHANFMLGGNQYEHFPAYLKLAASAVGISQLRRLLRDRDWRPGLAAGWFVGIAGRKELAAVLVERLSRTAGAYDDQGICVGLGLLGGGVAQQALWTYLDNTLPCRGTSGHQGWALGALAYLEGAPPHRYTSANLWSEKAEPQRAIQEFASIVNFLKSHKVIGA